MGFAKIYTLNRQVRASQQVSKLLKAKSESVPYAQHIGYFITQNICVSNNNQIFFFSHRWCCTVMNRSGAVLCRHRLLTVLPSSTAWTTKVEMHRQTLKHLYFCKKLHPGFYSISPDDISSNVENVFKRFLGIEINSFQFSLFEEVSFQRLNENLCGGIKRKVE